VSQEYQHSEDSSLNQLNLKMKFGFALLAAAAAQTAVAASVASQAAFSTEEIVDLLMVNPHLQTPNSTYKKQLV
jgi:hypothetical protein